MNNGFLKNSAVPSLFPRRTNATMVSESQFITWSNPGAQETAKRTHESIRNAIDSQNWRSDIKYSIYLQGSYKNSTNIRGDSDVDVVVELESTFLPDLSLLSSNEQILYRLSNSGSATYTWQDFRRDIFAVLSSHFGIRNVTYGNKSIKIARSLGRLHADVVVVLQSKKFLSFQAHQNSITTDGIAFCRQPDSKWVINYPKQHFDNGCAKNLRTNGDYKKTVRVFKNIRCRAIDLRLLDSKVAPSYFIECLLWNVPDYLFSGTYQERMIGILDFILKADRSRFFCQNNLHLLFSWDQWDEGSMGAYLGALLKVIKN